jgi:alkylmercury lyase
MQTSFDITRIAEALTTTSARGQASADLFRVLLCELAMGHPVSRKRLAAALGWTAGEVTAALEQVPSLEYDDLGNIVGYGLTLRETPHVFEMDGRRLYTWCALDALMFPSLLGKTARITSFCAATRAPVRLTVTPDAVRDLDPAGAMVSLVPPDASADIRSVFCCHVHFFASAAAAEAWAGTHANGAVVSVHDAFLLGQALARRLSAPTLPSCAPSCGEAQP